MRYYVDTSAAAKLIVEEPESDSLARFLDDASSRGAVLFSSLLLETELRRLAVRLDLDQASVIEILHRFDLLIPDSA